MLVRSLHIPAAPSLWTQGTGLIVVLAFGAASYVFHHTVLGDSLREMPLVYFVGFHLTFAIAPGAGILGHIAAGRPATLGWLGLGLGARELSAAVAAFTLGCVVASFTIGTRVATPGGLDEAMRLFASLLVATASEAIVVLGVAANLIVLALRGYWKKAPARVPEAIAALAATLLFGVFQLGHSPPLDGLENAPRLVLVWATTSAIFLLTRSLVAAILFLNTMALVSVMEQEIDLQDTLQRSVALAGFALALFIGTLWLSNLGNRQSGNRHSGNR